MTLNYADFMAKMKAKFDEYHLLKGELDQAENKEIIKLKAKFDLMLIEETKLINLKYVEKHKLLNEQFKNFGFITET